MNVDELLEMEPEKLAMHLHTLSNMDKGVVICLLVGMVKSLQDDVSIASAELRDRE